jgi:ABC-type uncharacterized transport system permease subunit
MIAIRKYSKALAALAGSVTPSVVIGLLALAGVHVAPTIEAVIVAVLATVATWAAPANAAPVVVPAQPAP